MGLRAEGIISASLRLAAVRGDKQENQYSHSGQFTTRAFPQCSYLSESVPQAGWGWELLTRKVSEHTDHTVRERLKSMFSTMDCSRHRLRTQAKCWP